MTTLRQTIVISGGSSGIGLDLAKAYAALGANIILLARNANRLQQALDACEVLRQSTEQQFLARSVDVADRTRLQECVAELGDQLPAPDIVILSAGVVASERFTEQSDDSFDSIMQINVMGARAVARAFLPAMIAQGHGQLCFVSSLGGLIATYGYSAYSASKFAVVGMASALRQELDGSGVSVTLLCPPEVDTPMVAKESEHILPQTRFIKDVGGTLDVATVTKATLKGIERRQFIVIPGTMARLSYWQSRWFPGLFNAFLLLLVRIANRKQGKS
ncbi:SDR family NAD(P)-dependent oxidoreductase [Aestuariirhabdus sp. LZHN29]|uniref:SDR family NAD(P)-dependent oxidoreductase n=1 Tax=Aestuariirhabdus sp. LZHN29 TaxID=3417462 RepID=UPI003CE8BE80